MKKIQFFIFSLLGLLLFSCNPNQEVYEQLDAMRTPFHKSLSYTLTDDDYTTIKSLALPYAQNAEDSANINDIATFKSFAPTRSAADYVPYFLESKFLALDSSSSILVNYRFDNHFSFADNMQITVEDTLIYPNFKNYASVLDEQIANPQDGDYAVVKITWSKDDRFFKGYILYYFDGTSWARPDNSYELLYSDYEEMDGDVAKYHNFSSSASPEFYLPIFLKQKFPYSAAGDEKQLVYNYYEGGAKIVFNKAFYDGENWSIIEEKSDQFIHNGEKWVFDPTIKFEMSKSDYQYIVDWVANNDTLNGYVNSYGSGEYYFGASAYYGNFDMRVYKRQDNDPNGYLTGLSDEEASEVIWARLPLGCQIFLESKYPDAQPFVNGVPVYYEVTFATYEPERHKYMIKYLCTEVGKFEYIEGPTMVQ